MHEATDTHKSDGSLLPTYMSEEGNKNPRNMDKRSAKALPSRLDLAVVSSSGHGSEYHLGHRWICAGR